MSRRLWRDQVERLPEGDKSAFIFHVLSEYEAGRFVLQPERKRPKGQNVTQTVSIRGIPDSCTSARLRQLLDSYWQSGLVPERRRELERQIKKYDRIIGALMPVAG